VSCRATLATQSSSLPARMPAQRYAARPQLVPGLCECRPDHHSGCPAPGPRRAPHGRDRRLRARPPHRPRRRRGRPPPGNLRRARPLPGQRRPGRHPGYGGSWPGTTRPSIPAGTSPASATTPRRWVRKPATAGAKACPTTAAASPWPAQRRAHPRQRRRLATRDRPHRPAARPAPAAPAAATAPARPPRRDHRVPRPRRSRARAHLTRLAGAPCETSAHRIRGHYLAGRNAQGKRPSVPGLAGRAGLTSTTFRRRFPGLAREISAARAAPARPARTRRGPGPRDALVCPQRQTPARQPHPWPVNRGWPPPGFNAPARATPGCAASSRTAATSHGPAGPAGPGTADRY